MQTQGSFTFGTSGASTTNFTNDTNFAYLGGTPYTGVAPYTGYTPDWTKVVNGFVPGTALPGPNQSLTFTCDWTISGTQGSGKILSVTFSTGPGGGNHVIVVLKAGGGTLIDGRPYIFYPPSTSMVCFKEDTKILTNNGYVAIQNLRKGDMIKTLKNGYQPIAMIGKRAIYHPASNERIKDQLYNCSRREYKEVFDDLIITGCHCILVDEFTDEAQKQKTIEVNRKIYATDNKYRLPACVDSRAGIYEPSGTYTIYHLALCDRSNICNEVSD
jgi:hypothetical protein